MKITDPNDRFDQFKRFMVDYGSTCKQDALKNIDPNISDDEKTDRTQRLNNAETKTFVNLDDPYHNFETEVMDTARDPQEIANDISSYLTKRCNQMAGFAKTGNPYGE